MPRKSFKGRKRTFKKRVFKKKGGGKLVLKSQEGRISRGFLTNYTDINPFPPTLKTKLVYVGQGILSSSAGGSVTGSQVTFKLNSAYDPFSGVTAGWNNGTYNFTKLLAASGPYTRYKVNGVKLDILLFDSSGADADANELVLLLTSPTDTTNVSGILPYDAEKIPNARVVRLADSGSQRRRITQYMPMFQAFQWSKQQFHADKDSTTGPYNNDPASIPNLKIALANARSAATATTICLRVKITQYVELYARTSDAW